MPENLFCAGTYKKILEHIARPALAGAEIQFGAKMKSIQYRQNREDKVRMEVEDKGTTSFDEVVVTCPLGWLKQNTHAFEPPLNNRLLKAIDSIGYGCLEKVSQAQDAYSYARELMRLERSTSASRLRFG